MATPKTIRAKDIVADIRLGLSDDDLKSKYELSSSQLEKLFSKLVTTGAMKQEELVQRNVVEANETSEIRVSARSYSLFSIPIYDTSDLEVEGWITDITEQGLQVAGLFAEVGESRSLLIRADEFHDIYPFAFDAVCRWVSESPTEEPSVGFEITDLNNMGLEELRKLIQLLTIN